MNTKDDSILFGAKRAGITWLFKFYDRSEFDRAKIGAKRLGMSLAELLCGTKGSDAPDLPQPRKFTDKDRESCGLKIRIAECDPFTRRCLERQAALYECESVEEYMLISVFNTLENDEENAILDPETGDGVLSGLDLGRCIGCHVDKGAKDAPEPSSFTRKRIPRGTIVETYA